MDFSSHFGLFVAEDKPYTCDVCGRGFTQQGSRSVHMKKHAIAGTILLEYSGAVFIFKIPVSTFVGLRTYF